MSVMLGTIIVQTATQTPIPTPTPLNTPETGYGLAAFWLGLFFIGAAVVIGIAFIVGGWATIRGSIFTIDLTHRQRILFAIAVISLPIGVLSYFLGAGDISVATVLLGGIALVAGTLWAVLTAFKDRLGF